MTEREGAVNLSHKPTGEVPVKKILLTALLCSLVLFAWGFVSWTILPWHNTVANKFKSEAAVA